MIDNLLRAVLGLLGLLFLLVGASFLLDPVTAAERFGLTANGAKGLSSLRGDFTGYFWVAGGALLLGAWRRSGAIVLVTTALIGTTLAARALSLALDGTYEGWPQPMAVEAITVVVTLLASRRFARIAAGG